MTSLKQSHFSALVLFQPLYRRLQLGMYSCLVDDILTSSWLSSVSPLFQVTRVHQSVSFLLVLDTATLTAPNHTCKSWSGILHIGFTGTTVSTGFRQQKSLYRKLSPPSFILLHSHCLFFQELSLSGISHNSCTN